MTVRTRQRLKRSMAWAGAAGLACAICGVVLAQAANGTSDPQSERAVGEPADPALVRKGDIVRVTRIDGPALRGRVRSTNIETDEDGSPIAGALVLIVAGEPVNVEAENIDEVIIEDTAYRRYIATRSEIPDEDIESLLELVVWLQQHELYQEATDELGGILEREPTNSVARRRLEVIEALRDLQAERERAEAERRRERGSTESDGDARFVDGTRIRRPTPEELPSLTEEQINLIKVYEVDLRDPPVLVIERETIDRLIRRYGDSPLIPSSRLGRMAFRRLDPEKILEVMFRLRARDLYPEVQVIGSPVNMEQFRDEVHARWLLNRCGTTRCHGGVDAGRFQLINYAKGSDRTVYTNFVILDRYRSEDGLLKMIEWDEPEVSLLVQMGLPREDALYPHPDVRGFRPVFGGRDARRFAQTIEWIESMYRPRPDITLDFESPSERYDRLARERREREDAEQAEPIDTPAGEPEPSESTDAPADPGR